MHFRKHHLLALSVLFLAFPASAIEDTTTLREAIARDSTGQMVAMMLLCGLGGSLLAVLLPFAKPALMQALREDARYPLSMASILGLGLAFPLLSTSVRTTGVLLSLLLLLLFSAVFWSAAQERLAHWTQPLLLLGGLGISTHLLMLEPLASPNTLYLMGIPGSIWGIAWFALVFVLWGLSAFSHSPTATLSLAAGILLGAASAMILLISQTLTVGIASMWGMVAALVVLMSLWVTLPDVWALWHMQTPPNFDEQLEQRPS